MARARPTRFLIPPERADGIRSSTFLSPTIRSFATAAALTSASPIFMCRLRPNPTFSQTVNESNKAAPWKSIPNFFLSSTRPLSSRPSTSTPSTKTRPRSGLRRPIMCLMRTLFPVPDPPITTMLSPDRIARFTPLRTTFDPNALWTSRRLIFGSSSTGFPFIRQNRIVFKK